MKRYLIFTVFIVLAANIMAQGDMKETIGMVKKNLIESKANLKRYEWIETTTTFLDGAQKSVKQKQCYYSVDGKLVKVETGGSTQAKTPGGLRGKIAANKKEEMADYIEKALVKIDTYLPPDAVKIEQIYNAGKVSFQVLEPGKKFKLSFPDYNEPGDLFSLSIDKAAQKLMAGSISTSVGEPDQKVQFDVTFSNLPDGTQYAGNTTLDLQAKKLKIVIENSGFKKSAGQ